MDSKANERSLRLLATLEVLSEETDAVSGISAGDLRRAVAERVSAMLGVEVRTPDKRTLYDDIEALRIAGYEVERGKGTRGRYSLRTSFEQWELRFLADAARTSRSLTEEQGERIVAKLKKMASSGGRCMLDRRLEVQQLYHSGSFEQTAYALDEIERALDNGWKLSYVQERRSPDGRKVTRRQRGTGNEVRVVDPVEYVYSAEGYYYLIILDPTSKSGVKTPRIDRMANVVALTGRKAEQVPLERKAAILEGFRQSFGMFESRPVAVTLGARAEHVKSVIDRFGDAASFEAVSPGRSLATVRVGLSDVFYSWIAQFAGEVVVEGPPEAAEGMRAFLERNMRAYPRDA